jgi:predicted ATPase
LLAIDGLHWCDPHTLEWLPYLLRFDTRARLLVVGTCRLDERQVDERLSPLLRSLLRDNQLTRIELPRLDVAETAKLAATVAGRELDPLLATCLHTETEGNPLFVVETVLSGLPDEVRESPTGELVCIPRPLPPRIQEALEARLSKLSSRARRLAELAATIGCEFDFAVLAGASDFGETPLVRALDELWQLGIVREHGADRYDFSHDRLREVAYTSASAARRRSYHRRVAKSLEVVYGDSLDVAAALLATHYERAGLSRRADHYRRRAAEFARELSVGQTHTLSPIP